MTKNNLEIRKLARENGVPLWRIGEAMGLSDYAFSRKLRAELSIAEQQQAKEIISELAGDQKGLAETEDKLRSNAGSLARAICSLSRGETLVIRKSQRHLFTAYVCRRKKDGVPMNE